MNDDVLEPQPVEDLDIGVPMQVVGLLQSLIVDVEGIGVLHHELPAAQQAGSRPRLVAILRLDLVQRERQILVGGVEVLHQQGEHLLMSWTQQVVRVLTVFEPEDAFAIFGQRPVASYGSRGSKAGKCTSWAPMASISS